MYLIHTPRFIQNLFPGFVWRIPGKEKVIYLTFDDGPIPEVTPWVLDQLDEYDAKATFFCVGENIIKHHDIFQRLLNEGHQIGNHTYNHLSGWSTEDVPYFHNIRKCASLAKTELFRPPYGRLRPRQVQFLQRHYKIIMWDVLSGDFDANISKEQCLSNVLNNTRKGSIVVFHDNIKSFDHLQYTLPKVLAYFSEKGYRFEAIGTTISNKKTPIHKMESLV